MMIIRMTGQLAKLIGISVMNSAPLAQNPYQDWTCRLFTVSDGSSYVLSTNTASLYSALLPWAGPIESDSFRNILFGGLEQHLTLDGFRAIYTAYIEPEEMSAEIAKSLNRSVTGSMNDMTQLAEYMLVEERRSLRETSDRLNDTPFGALDYDHPQNRFAALATQLTSD